MAKLPGVRERIHQPIWESSTRMRMGLDVGVNCMMFCEVKLFGKWHFYGKVPFISRNGALHYVLGGKFRLNPSMKARTPLPFSYRGFPTDPSLPLEVHWNHERNENNVSWISGEDMQHLIDAWDALYGEYAKTGSHYPPEPGASRSQFSSCYNTRTAERNDGSHCYLRRGHMGACCTQMLLSMQQFFQEAIGAMDAIGGTHWGIGGASEVDHDPEQGGRVPPGVEAYRFVFWFDGQDEGID